MQKLFQILKASFKFKKPMKKKVLIFDRASIDNGMGVKFFKSSEYEILDIRFESLNIYVFFYTILKFGFNGLKFNYFKSYMEIVEPKIVYTGIDNKLDFFKLKNYYENAFFISDQFGISKNPYASHKGKIKKDFFWHCKEYLKKTKKKLRADILFTFGTNEARNMSRFIHGKYYPLGSTKNNFNVHKRRKIKKIKKITFICGGIYPATINDEKKIFRNLVMFGKKNNYEISFLSRFDSDKENFFRENYIKDGWKYLPRKNSNSSYNYLNNSELIVFTHGSLGFEALSKGIRVVSFYSNFPEKSSCINYNRKGQFWSNSSNYSDFENLVKKVINYSDKEWNKIRKRFSGQIMFYDKNNKLKKKIISQIKNKNL